MTYIDSIMRLAIIAAGILGALFGLFLIRRNRQSGDQQRLAVGFFIWPNTISAVIIVLTVIGVLVRLTINASWTMASDAALLLGWILMLGMFSASRVVGRRLSSDIPDAGAGFDLLSASGFLSGSAALIGPSVLMLTVPPVLPPENMLGMGGMLLALAVGFWIAVTFWSLPSALYRGLLAQEPDINPRDAASLCVRFRSISGETTFLTALALVVAAIMGVYHFTGKTPAGALYPLGVFAASLVFGMLVNRALVPQHAGSAANKIPGIVGVFIYVIGTGLASYFLAVRWLGDIQAFYCFIVGLFTAMLLMFTARYRPPFAGLGALFGVEIAVAQVLMVLASELLAYRWLSGYGVALCTVGLFASSTMLFPLGALWAIHRVEDDANDIADLPFVAHAASRFMEIVMAGGAFLLLVALLRLFYERMAGFTGIDIIEPYPMIGLIVGGSFPILLRSISLSGQVGHHAGSMETGVLVRLGRWASGRTLGIWALAIATPLLIAVFWRTEAVGAFLVGLAAAELFLVLTLWLGEVRNCADEGLRFATRSTHTLAVGSALVAVLLTPALIDATSMITRTDKLWALGAVFLVIFVWVLTVALRRLRSPQPA